MREKAVAKKLATLIIPVESGLMISRLQHDRDALVSARSNLER
jgi:hypothetical protein